MRQITSTRCPNISDVLVIVIKKKSKVGSSSRKKDFYVWRCHTHMVEVRDNFKIRSDVIYKQIQIWRTIGGHFKPPSLEKNHTRRLCFLYWPVIIGDGSNSVKEIDGDE